MTTLLVFGRSGQFARALKCRAQAAEMEVIHVGSHEMDLAVNPKAAGQKIAQAEGIDIVINASAYTAVDAAETDMTAARNLNAKAPEAMAKACKTAGLPFLHISTDYVFNGDNARPYKVTDKVSPINAYGLTKAEGEAAVMKANPASAIFRTSWLYDGEGQNFLTTMLRLGAQRTELSIVDDQNGRPTYAPHLADALFAAGLVMVNGKGLGGIYHVTGEGEPVSWYGFAYEIFRLATAFTTVPTNLRPIESKDFPTPAKRPAYSVLDNSHFSDTFGYKMPEWEKGLVDALAIVKSKRGEVLRNG